MNTRCPQNIPVVFRSRKTSMPVSVLRRIGLSAREATSLGMISVVTALSSVYFLLSIYITPEPYSVTNSLANIRTIMTKLEQHQFVSRLNSIEKYAVANKVHFVSSLINRNNRLRNNEVAISIVTESLRADVDPLLIAAIIKSESTFKVNAVSEKGARGLMQLMPDTARFAEARLLKPYWQRAGTDIHKIDYNISLGISYLKHLEDSFNGNRELALIAYNWGPGNLKNALKNKSHIPESTKSYARKIIRTHQRWQGEMKVLALVGNQEQPRKIPT